LKSLGVRLIETKERVGSKASNSSSSISPPQVDEMTKLLKIGIPKMLIIRVVSKDQTMLLRLSKEIKETGTKMIREFKLLSKITLLLRRKERKKMLILKSIVLETLPHFLI
jgi:hypothetical protein